jgi:hypothetical protein
MQRVDFSFSADGSQDLTVSSIDGHDELPIAAIFVVCGAENGSTPPARISQGWYDGTNQFSISCDDANGVTTSDSSTQSSSSVVGQLASGFSITANNFVPNGVNITTAGAYPDNTGYVMLFFGGGAGEAQAGLIDPEDEIGSIHVPVLFRSEVIFGMRLVEEGVSNNLQINIGFTVRGGNRVNSEFASIDNLATTQTNVTAGLSSMGPINFNNIDETGFDAATLSAIDPDTRIPYLALKLPYADISAGVIDTPDSISVLNVPTGHKVTGGLIQVGLLGELPGSSTIAPEAECYGLCGYNLTVSTETVSATTLEVTAADDVSTTITRSRIWTQLRAVDSAGANDVFATMIGNNSGFDLDFGVVGLSNRKWPYLVMGSKYGYRFP